MSPENASTQAVVPHRGISSPDARRLAVGLGVFALIAVAALTWAKWWPYIGRVGEILDTDAYPGSNVLEEAGPADASPSLAGGWDFTVAYFQAVWQALVAALLISAGVLTLIPRERVVRALSGGRWPTVTAGLWSMPSMMCSCCTAPVAASLRRSGVPTASALAYWVGNPVLNPAVIVFMAILLPWEWVATRIIVGALLVFVVTGWVARLATRRSVEAAEVEPDAGTVDDRPVVVRYFRALARLTVVLVPEYLVVVFVVGALRGWLFPFDGGATDWAILTVIGAAIVGTIVVIPTAGEIPILSRRWPPRAPAWV